MPLPLIPIFAGSAVILATTVAIAIQVNKMKTTYKQQGYEKAAQEFEKKFRKLCNDFFEKRKSYAKDRDEYEMLIRVLQAFLDMLQAENNFLKMKRIGTGATISGLASTSCLTERAGGLEKAISKYTKLLNDLLALKNE